MVDLERCTEYGAVVVVVVRGLGWRFIKRRMGLSRCASYYLCKLLWQGSHDKEGNKTITPSLQPTTQQHLAFSPQPFEPKGLDFG